MRRLAQLFVLSLMGAVLVAGPATAIDPIVATGHIQATVTTSGVIPLTLESPARLLLNDLDGDVDAVDLKGGGKLPGVLLQQQSARPGEGPSYLTVRVPESIPGVTELAVATGGCLECNLPAGAYSLYVIADGAPVTVDLTLDGLEGTTVLEDSAFAPVRSTVIEGASSPEVGLPGGVVARGAGASGTLEKIGAVLNIGLGWGVSNTVPNPPAPDAGGPVAQLAHGLCSGAPAGGYYTAPCANAQWQPGIAITRVFTKYAYADVAFSKSLDPGTYARGAYQTGAGTVDGFLQLGLWLELQ